MDVIEYLAVKQTNAMSAIIIKNIMDAENIYAQTIQIIDMTSATMITGGQTLLDIIAKTKKIVRDEKIIYLYN